MTKRLIALTGAAAMAMLAFASAAAADPPAKVENFTLLDQAGAAHELYSLSDAPAIVIATQVNGDPLSREGAKTLEELKSIFGKAEYIMLNSSPSDTRSTIAAEAAALHATIPILDDADQRVALALGAKQTGEAYVIDPISWQIVYHGPINTAAAADPETQFVLFNALTYFMSHRPMDETASAVKGTPIVISSHAQSPGAAN